MKEKESEEGLLDMEDTQKDTLETNVTAGGIVSLPRESKYVCKNVKVISHYKKFGHW